MKIVSTSLIVKEFLEKVILLFNLQWVLCNDFMKNVTQLLVGPSLALLHLLWDNGVQAILLEIWFGKNQHFSQVISLVWS